MTIDQKALAAAKAWFDAEFNGLPDTAMLAEGIITAYLAAAGNSEERRRRAAGPSEVKWPMLDPLKKYKNAALPASDHEVLVERLNMSALAIKEVERAMPAYAGTSDLLSEAATALSAPVNDDDNAAKWRENVEHMLSNGDPDVLRCREGGGPESLIGSLVLTMMRTRNSRDTALSAGVRVKGLVDAKKRMQEALDLHDAEVADQLASEGERADLWTDIEVLVDDLRVILSALSNAPVVTDGWRPIETAPKDGAEMVGYRPDQGVFVFRWAWMEEFVPKDQHGDPIEDYDDSLSDWWHDRWGWMEGELRPTHWKPLPAAPALSPQSGEQS